MEAVAHSAGTAKPRMSAPPGACDCHIHVYDARFPATGAGGAILERATAGEYRRFQARIGTTRAVIVQPRTNGTDNAVTLDAIAQLGRANAKGVAVLRDDATDAEIARLDAGGVRGLRFSLHEPQHGVTTFAMIEPLARRIADRGWHAQLHLTGDQLAANAALVERLPCRVVIDHLARLGVPDGRKHPAYALVRRLLDAGRTWIKVSGPYLDSRMGGPAWADIEPLARDLIAAAPERMLWGSDWPHPTERDAKPDDAEWFDRLADWTPDEATRTRILAANPRELYGFD